MFKYLFLIVVTLVALLIHNYVAGIGIYVAGLIVYEILAVIAIVKRRKNARNIGTNINS